MQYKIGDCRCLDYDHRYLMLRTAKEAISREKDVMSKVDKDRKKLIAKGMNPGLMIKTGRQFIEKIEKTVTAIKEIPTC